jgi:hypothetical protein
MMITPQSKRVIPFRPLDAKRIGNGCYYLDLIVWRQRRIQLRLLRQRLWWTLCWRQYHVRTVLDGSHRQS